MVLRSREKNTWKRYMIFGEPESATNVKKNTSHLPTGQLPGGPRHTAILGAQRLAIHPTVRRSSLLVWNNSMGSPSVSPLMERKWQLKISRHQLLFCCYYPRCRLDSGAFGYTVYSFRVGINSHNQRVTRLSARVGWEGEAGGFCRYPPPRRGVPPPYMCRHQAGIQPHGSRPPKKKEGWKFEGENVRC